jgi:cyclase
MSFPRLIPVLLLENRRLVKTTNFRDASYVGDPLNTIRIFNKKEVDEIVVLDIRAHKNNQDPDYEYLEELSSECFMPLTYGGGITTSEIAKRVMECGVEKVCLNSGFIGNNELPETISRQLGRSSTILSVDVYKANNGYAILGCDEELENYIEKADKLGFGEILIQSVDRDGLLAGPDLELVKIVSRATNLPIIYSGGISNLEQCSNVWNLGASGVGAGAWFVYRGPHRAVMITYPKYDKVKSAFTKKTV